MTVSAVVTSGYLKLFEFSGQVQKRGETVIIINNFWICCWNQYFEQPFLVYVTIGRP